MKNMFIAAVTLLIIFGFIIELSSCICENLTDGASAGEVMCNYYGVFERYFSCPLNTICTGPTNKENAIQAKVASEFLCTDGKLIR